MTSILYTVLLIGSCLFLMKKKVDTESSFTLKIIGYFIVGSFAFTFNQIAVPLGFIVYLLFFRPKLNVRVKRLAAIFGVLTFIVVHWIIPFAIHEWESRALLIERNIGSIYTLNFDAEFEKIKQKLEVENNAVKLQDFKIEYLENGQITDVSWQILRYSDSKYHLYQIQYDFAKNRYEIRGHEVDEWLQYNRLVEGDRFFENLNVLDMKDITQSKGSFSSYVIHSTGERVHYGIEDREHFVISNGEIQVVDNEQLPVEAYYISIFAMHKTEEERDEQGNIIYESFEGTAVSEYLFDVNVVKK
ncbi:hypothetical protein [Ferdinandcohnia sp. Marseille-Q9671]